jgi:hypothetical protein
MPFPIKMGRWKDTGRINLIGARIPKEIGWGFHPSRSIALQIE